MLLPTAEVHERSRLHRELSSTSRSPAPLKVSVLVTLFRHEHAGGHVKCWERFGQVATRQPQLDLTVHFLGQTEQVVPLSDNVRFRLHPPRLSTRRFSFFSQLPDHTDVGGYNHTLAGALRDCDVIHSTDAFFSFAETGLVVSRRRGIPLVNSVHTDTPSYTRVYTTQVIERICGKGWIRRALVDGCKVHLRAEQRMQRVLERYQLRSSCVLVSKPDDYIALRRRRPADEVGVLRRGVDKSLFNPARRDRAWLQRLGIPIHRVLVLFVGRLSAGKNVLQLTEAIAQLIDEGLPVHLICAGDGPLRQSILERLGTHASCLGMVAAEDLARLYASVDLLAAPSEIEVVSNVVQEALASGLSTVLAKRSGMGRLITSEATGLIVEDSSVRGWTEALRAICLGPERRARMGRAARELAEKELPSWDEVLSQDLMPRWQKLAARMRATSWR